MKKILFILISFIILLGCEKNDTKKCELNDTYDLELINNSDLIIIVYIWTYDISKEPYYLDTSIEIDFVKELWMGEGQVTLLKNLQTGYTIFGYGEGRYDNIPIKWHYYDEFLTESCETYTLEIKNITIDN